MAFWGIEVKPGRPYTHRFDNERGRLHLSQATLGTGSSTKKSILQCNVGDKRPIYLCSLLPEKLETCPLNHEFEEDEEVIFSVIGPHSVHLSGFFHGESQGYAGDDYGSGSDFEEDIAGSETDESSDYDTEDEYDDDFIDDDLDVYPPSPVPNSGVVIEEIFDDEKPANENATSKQGKKNQSSNSDGNINTERQIIVKGNTDGMVLESEDEDGFPVSLPDKSKADAPSIERKEEENKDKITDVKAKKKKAKDDKGGGKSLKRKVDAIVENDEQKREIGQELNEVVFETDAKQTKKDKKKRVKGKEEKIHEAGTGNKGKHESEMEQAPSTGKEDDQKLTTEKNNLSISTDSVAEDKKKKKKKKNKKQGNEVDGTSDQTLVNKHGSAGEMDNKTESKPFQVRTFPNGLVVEELAMGKPDGKKASPGKKVSVHYIGKLHKNGKIFDSNVGRAPFKFRLGIGQVIKGWDVGVNGMRIGDKRRLTIPPSMGYGAKGAGPIPPNSWLVFDVELVDVN
ncbi:Peptidylprolyl isomerase [Bertholletia excelsa]